MNFLTWNCRGTASKGFTSLIKELRREYKASLIFLLETHSSGSNALKQARKTGFSGQHIVDARGHSGGIWCLWDLAVWKVEILECSDQFVHIKVVWNSQVTWLVAVVYGSPRYVKRNDLWADLIRLGNSLDLPWIVLGDFNCILVDHERRGGAQNFAIRGRQDFREMVQECHLLDMGFQGRPFTWKHGNLFQRLDRVFCNLSWRLKFPNASVIHLPFFKLDHRAVMVQMKKVHRPNKRHRPFRFVASWLSHADFPRFLSLCWPRNAEWRSQVNRFQGEVQNLE